MVARGSSFKVNFEAPLGKRAYFLSLYEVTYETNWAFSLIKLSALNIIALLRIEIDASLNTELNISIMQALNMSHNSSAHSNSVLWTGKPWILPGALTRSIFLAAIAVVVVWLEFFLEIADQTIAGVDLMLWTGLVFFVLWLLSLMHLVLLRASNTYILRNDSLEIMSGILTSRSFMISPSGFSDLEVVRSISARIINSGDIIIRTQSETDSEKKMVRIRNPLKAADQIREVMARPIVRIDRSDSTEEKKQS